MKMQRWNPFREFDDWFRDYHHGMLRQLGEPHTVTGSDWLPAVDILENSEEYQIKVEIPEIRKEDVKLTVNNGLLTISGERKLENLDDKQHRMERVYGHFSRSFNLPEDVRAENITGHFRDGMLFVHMVKSSPPEDKALEIEIK